MMQVRFDQQLALGILVCYNARGKRPPFSDSRYYWELSFEGKKHNMDVIVFSPKEVDWATRKVPCWYVDASKNWRQDIRPLPPLIYDRCYYADSKQYLAYHPFTDKIRNDPHLRLLGRPLGGKLKTHQLLIESEEIRPFLPTTLRYQSAKELMQFIHKHQAGLIKPNGGSHGRGVVAITKHPEGIHVRGRSKQNETLQYFFHEEPKFRLWVNKFIGSTNYIIQPFLRLTTVDHRPFDLRILVQKNEVKEWITTGMAVRTGDPDTITSNLHGGGTAAVFDQFMEKHFPEELRKAITKKIHHLASVVPPFIEKNHGPLLELGLDVGIDVEGNVWILEVNSKPGRSIFLKTGEKETRKRAIQLPMKYAYALLMSS